MFNAIARHRIDIELIARHWEDLLRLAGSLKLGHVHPDAVMRDAAGQGPPHRARPRARRTRPHHQDPAHARLHRREEKRRRILTQLNRHESRHRLTPRVCHGDRGEIRKAHRQGQEEQLGVLGLVLNAIALWNATYIRAALDRLTREGWDSANRHRQGLTACLQAHQLPRPIRLQPAVSHRRGSRARLPGAAEFPSMAFSNG